MEFVGAVSLSSSIGLLFANNFFFKHVAETAVYTVKVVLIGFSVLPLACTRPVSL